MVVIKVRYTCKMYYTYPKREYELNSPNYQFEYEMFFKCRAKVFMQFNQCHLNILR